MTAEQLVGYRGEIVYDFAQRSGLNNRFIVHLGIWQDSVAVETMKKDYVRLSGVKNRSADDQARFEQLEEALKDLPDWHVVPERDVRRDQLLADIKAALDKQGR